MSSEIPVMPETQRSDDELSLGKTASRPPINFVIPSEMIWEELRGGQLPTIDGSRLSKLSGGILNNWLQRTYYNLRKAGIDAVISSTPKTNSINFASIRDFGRRERKLDCFIVIPRGDAHEPKLANFVIYQNGFGSRNSRRTSIPHWIQPGIMPRDTERGTEVKVLSYKGRLYNLLKEVQTERFRAELEKRGIIADYDGFDAPLGDHDWNDYRHADVSVSIRNLTHYDASKKPASKLVNSWLAGVPAIVGPEPAFLELQKSEFDFLLARSADDVLAAIDRLISDPQLFEKMVSNGFERAREFEEAEITRQWIDAIDEKIMPEFERWKSKPLLLRQAGALLGLILEAPSKRIDLYRSLNGTRILDS